MPVEVGVVDQPSRVDLWSLVLSSATIAHCFEKRADGWVVMVPPYLAGRARRELELFEQENAGWPPVESRRGDSAPLGPVHLPLVVLILGALMGFHGVTGPWLPGNDWFVRGAVWGRAMFADHEWWRLITALTLHSGPVHLTGNVAVGGVLLFFLANRLGIGLGFFLALLAGAVGNGLNVCLQGAEHLSAGFSTAVFGMVGILCGLEIRRGGTAREVLLPLGAGFALLAMLGTTGERTDLWAHWWGLLAGLGLGILLSRAPGRQAWSGRIFPQTLLFLIGAGLLLGAWAMALAV